jgi:hypothetical protein
VRYTHPQDPPGLAEQHALLWKDRPWTPCWADDPDTSRIDGDCGTPTRTEAGLCRRHYAEIVGWEE